jgi:nicotinamidase-related amidase
MKPVDALVIIDMQEGMLKGDPKHDLDAVVERINRLAARVRQRGGHVVFVQHNGSAGDDFEPHAPGWSLLSSLRREPEDRIVHKTLNDAFFGSTLQSELVELGVTRLLVAGWATDFCVDSTIRSAVALGFRVFVVADCHTLSDRPHLGAEQVIAYHHWIWEHLIAPHPVTIACEAEL